MRTLLTLGLGGLTVVGTYWLTGMDANRGAPPNPNAIVNANADAIAIAASEAKFGHLVLQVEGNIRELAVTWITPKVAAYNASRVRSPYSIELLDQAGERVGNYPLDLASFDLEPNRVGQPLRVEGCRVWDSRIATLVSVPFSPRTTALRILHGQKIIGRLGAARLATLLTAGSNR